jgi:hypothetical protein
VAARGPPLRVIEGSPGDEVPGDQVADKLHESTFLWREPSHSFPQGQFARVSRRKPAARVQCRES